MSLFKGKAMTKTLWAVTTMGVITNISFNHDGRTVWVKAIFETQCEADNRAAKMNEINHYIPVVGNNGLYTVEPIAVKITRRTKV